MAKTNFEKLRVYQFIGETGRSGLGNCTWLELLRPHHCWEATRFRG